MATLIEEFLYKFISDTKDYEKGTKSVAEGNKKAAESMAKNDEAAHRLIGSFKDLAAGALSVGAAFLSLAGIRAVTQEAAEQTTAIAAQARELRMSADTLDVWQRANIAAGGSAEGMTRTLEMLKERTKDPIRALEVLADRFKGLNDFQADKLGAALGLDAGTVQMMRQGSAGLVEQIRLQQRLGFVTEEQIALAKEWKLQQHLNTFVMDDVKRVIMQGVLPSVIEWLKAMRNVVLWMRDNKEFTLAFFGAIATIITARLIPALARAALLAAPWIALAAAVAAVGGAIALVVDDIMAFETGGKSMIAEISKSWPIVGEIVHTIADAFYALRDAASVVFGYLRDLIFEPTKALENFHIRMDKVLGAMSERFPAMAALFKSMGKDLGLLFDIIGKVASFAWEWLKKVGDIVGWVAEKTGALAALKGMVGIGTDDQGNPTPTKRYQSPKGIESGGVPTAPTLTYKGNPLNSPAANDAKATVQNGKAALSASQHPLASSTSGAINNSKTVSRSTNVTTGPITVQTNATNGDEVAAALGKGIANQTRAAVDEFDDGMAI